MSPFAIIQAVLSILPLISAIVTTVESTVPAGTGKEKLNAAKGMLEAAYGLTKTTEVTFIQVWPAIEGIIASFVSLLNQTKVFKHSQVPRPQTEPDQM